MNVVAVIGDVVSSRALPGRIQFQKRLEGCSLKTSRLAGPNLISPFTVTLGDEVQAVYSDATGLLDHLLYFLGGVSPQQMRFAIGIGPLTTRLNRERAIGMDGPAFHAARDGLELQKASKTICAIWPASGMEDPALGAADAAVRLMSIQIGRWKPARWNVVTRLVEGKSETEVASELGIERQGVNQHVLGGAVRVVRAAGERVNAVLTEKLGSA